MKHQASAECHPQGREAKSSHALLLLVFSWAMKDSFSSLYHPRSKTDVVETNISQIHSSLFHYSSQLLHYPQPSLTARSERCVMLVAADVALSCLPETEMKSRLQRSPHPHASFLFFIFKLVFFCPNRCWLTRLEAIYWLTAFHLQPKRPFAKNTVVIRGKVPILRLMWS